MANQISGNAVAVNAKIILRAIFPSGAGDNVIQRVYTDANGNYTFSNVIAGTYQLSANLSETTAAPYNSGYSYREPVIVTMDAAGDNMANINLTPVLLNAVNPVTNQR